MATPMVFSDAEQIIVDWLSSELTAYGTTVAVSTRVPSPRPTTFVRVLRSGGVIYSRVTEAAMITVDCYADKESDAEALAQKVRALLRYAPGQLVSPVCYRVDEVGGPVNEPDPLTSQARYSQTFEIHLRGSDLEPES